MKWEMIHSMKTLEVTNLKGGKNTYKLTDTRGKKPTRTKEEIPEAN
jgi:hypothetical protein